MELLKIKDKLCPHCKCDVIIEEKKENQHCSGNWNESRKFDCGFGYQYSPNGGGVQRSNYNTCKHDPEIKERNNKRRIAKEKCYGFFQKLDVDDAFKASLSDSILYK